MVRSVEAEAPNLSSSSQSVTVFHAIADGLDELGVTDVFGLMGDDTVRLVSALVGRGVPYHNARHENAAIAMAAGHASATGRLAVCIISRGPGTTNGVTAAVNAHRGNAPLIVITGDERAESIGNSVSRPDSKALDSWGVIRGAGLRVFTPSLPDSVRNSLVEAATHASAGHTVFFTIPQDVFQQHVSADDDSTLNVAFKTPVPAPARAEALLAATKLIESSERPLILAGGGAWAAGATEPLLELADRIGAVLATTLRGKDMFRGSPYDVGIMGSFSHSAGRRLTDEADCVLVFGASLNRYTTNDGTSLPAAPLIHIDRDRDNIGRYHWADVSVVGDSRLVAEQLLDMLPPRSDDRKPWHTESTRSSLARYSPYDDFEPIESRWVLDPRVLLIELDRLLPADRAVVTDNGNFFGFVPSHVSVPSPDRFKLSSDFAVIGLGLGTALGVAVARPTVPTILFIGDGGLLMSLGELETLARLQIPLIVVVMNDRAYGAEKHFLELRDFSGTTAEFPDVEFQAVAEAFGIEGATIQSVDDLKAIADELHDRSTPYLLDCKVSAAVVAPFLSGHV